MRFSEAHFRNPSRRSLRRIGVAVALIAASLVAAQVVLADPPQNVSFTISDTTPNRGQSVNFDASDATDPEGGAVTYSWSFGDGTTGSGQHVSHSYPNSAPAGLKTVTLTVTDSADESTPVSEQLDLQNQLPSAAVSCTPATVLPNQATSCGSSGSGDPDGSISYVWDSDGDGFDDGTDPSENFSFATPGAKTIRLQVRDSDNATAVAQDSVTVSNAAPTASFTFSPANPNVGQTVNFNGSGSSDPEGQTLTYAWALDGDGLFNDGGGQPTASRPFPTGGNKTVQLRVTDPQGNSDVETKIVPVANADPVAGFTVAGANPVTPAVPDVNEQVNFTSTSTDPDGNGTIVDWDWDLDNDGAFDDASGQTASRSFPTEGTKTVGLLVRDSSGATNSTTRTVRVNALPVARANSLNPQGEPGQRYNVPLVAQPILFTGAAVPLLPGTSPAQGCPTAAPSAAAPGTTDAEGAIPSANYKWDIDNDGQFDDATGVEAPYVGFPTAGNRTVRLQVTDSDQATDVATLQLRVNTAPTTQFVFEPLTPIIGQEITFGSTAFDPNPEDAGKLTYSWDLDNDGNFCETGETGASVKRTFTTANTSPGHPVTLKVTDDGGITRTLTRNVIVQNTVPTGSISFSPAAPLPGHNVRFTGSASSPTGKPIASRQWDFNFNTNTGQFDVEATGASVNRAFSTPGPRTVAMRIQETGGGFAIITRTVNVNAPPRARFSVAPGTVFVGDTVTISSSSFDPDGPLTKQEWDLDNDGSFDDANAAIVSATFGRPGTYPLRLRVTDSRGATSTANGQVTIRTRPVPPPQVLPGVVIEMRALVFSRNTEVRYLRVRAPAGSKIKVRCLGGKRCPTTGTKTSHGSKRLRFKKLERTFRPGTKLIITVTKPGFIGRQTSFKLRRGKGPVRKDLCRLPGAKNATSCPGG
jgi:PKD repeat protein